MNAEEAKTTFMQVAAGLVLGMAATANAGSVMPVAYDTAAQKGPLTGPESRPLRSVTLVQPVVYDTAAIRGGLEKEIAVNRGAPAGESEFAAMEPGSGPAWELLPLD